MSDIRPLRKVQEEASAKEVRKALELYGDVGRASLDLEVHENTVRFYMKRHGITTEMVREWKDARLRQRTMEFNGR